MSIVISAAVAALSYLLLRAFLTERPPTAADVSGTPLAQEVPA
jgi:hypothetical protein